MFSSIKNVLVRVRSRYRRCVEMNRSSYWKLQMCGTEEEMREVAGRICRNYLHGAWKSTDPRDLDFKRISGGLSNFLYYVALPSEPAKLGGFRRESSPDADQDLKLKKQMLSAHSFSLDEPKKVLLRIYGQVHGERAMDAIVTESVIFTLLSERRLGPKLHGVFSGGRIEEYIPARALLTKELSEPALSMKIAEKMAAIHSMDVPLSKEPNWLWKTMAKWLRTVKEERLAALPANMRAEERRVAERLRAVEWEAEIEWLKRLTAALNSPVVFCHNDMQEGNILILEDEVETGGEGSGMEGEWCYDYTNPEHPFYYENYENAPTLEQKEIFIKEYLKHAGEPDAAESIDEINRLLDEIDAFALASHLFWSLWSIVNASKSQIPFGYWEYGLSRLETYLRLKQELIKKEKYGFPQKRKICEVDI
ncbi:choline/ethanolamine kinase-like [Zerene cesonia]|uniref:choline/ethanolamine kinase-like n=1 Tax=Zerene cesonia TaxID=33412 RepID=UPI0018E57C49|nr:choline/ethanolamine kinase-like [Zerene cesonia]